MSRNTDKPLALTRPVVQQLEQLLNEVGPDDAVIIQKRRGRIHRFMKQASIHIRKGQEPAVVGQGGE